MKPLRPAFPQTLRPRRSTGRARTAAAASLPCHEVNIERKALPLPLPLSLSLSPSLSKYIYIYKCVYA